MGVLVHSGRKSQIALAVNARARGSDSKKGLTQTEAAELLGIQQSRVSDLVRGKIDRFGIDTLVNLLAKAGRRMEIRVKQRQAAA